MVHCFAAVQAGICAALGQLVVQLGSNDCSLADELSPAGILSLLQVCTISASFSKCCPCLTSRMIRLGP